jgi:hypothetical protein
MFIETDFNCGYLHTDSKKCRRKAFSSLFIYLFIYLFIDAGICIVFYGLVRALVCSLCCVRYLYLSLVFILGCHEDLICMSVISGLFLWRSWKLTLNYEF